MRSIVKAARYHQCGNLLDEQANYTDPIYWRNFENLALVELHIRGESSGEEIDTIDQNDQVPYMEFYLDWTGTRLLSRDDATLTRDYRLCFFLHFVDVAGLLAVGSDLLTMPSMSPLPQRLEPFTHYLPVD